MLELWTIEPSPTPKDPSRHVLWLKGHLADVQALIRRFGALCGRPQKDRGSSEYDYTLFLHGAGPDVLERVESWLKTLAPAGASAAPAPAAAAPIEELPATAITTAPPAPVTASPFGDLMPGSAARPATPMPASVSTPTPPPAAMPPAGAPAFAIFADLAARTPPPAEAAPAMLEQAPPLAPEGAPTPPPVAAPAEPPPPVMAEPLQAIEEPPMPVFGAPPLEAEAPPPAALPDIPQFGAPAQTPLPPPLPSAEPPAVAPPLPEEAPLPSFGATPFPAPAAEPMPSIPRTPFPAPPVTPMPAIAPVPEVAAPPMPAIAPTPFPSPAETLPPAAAPMPAPAPLSEAAPPDAQPPAMEAPPPLMEAPPPLMEAPAWPDAPPAAVAPAGSGAAAGALSESPFANLPPAPSMFPGVAEAAPSAMASMFPQAEETAPAAKAPPAAAPAPAPAPAAEPALAAAAPSPLGELLGAPVPLNPAYTLDTLQVGSFNRFSHAASMSVIANPGAMYNPLFLFGSPGVGKTHLLSAIGKALQDSPPKEKVFPTTGPRLARAVAEAKRLGRFDELEAHVKKTKALLIDDIHVLGVNDQNQEGLVSILGSYFSSGKQVVMTSVYPPRALGGLEEALKFQISAGWSVDMKPVNAPEVQKEILGPAMARAGFELDSALIDGVIPKLEGSFGELNRWVERLRALLELRSLNHQPSTLQDLFPILLMPDVPATAPSTTEEVQNLLHDMPPNPADPNAVPAVVCFPKGMEAHGEYVVRQFHSVMAQNHWPIQVKIVQSLEYDPEQLFGVPFVLGEACQAAGARAALVLGPSPGSGLAAREVELQHAVQHLFEGLDMRVGWISFLRIKEAGPYFRGGLDLFSIFRGPT